MIFKGRRTFRLRPIQIGLALIAALSHPVLSNANGIGENGSWQFQTSQDRAAKGVIADLIERKKGGYYDSFSVTNNISNNTFIDKQLNCSVSAGSTGNSGSSGMSASTSSPTSTNASTTDASTSANGASNGTGQGGWPSGQSGGIASNQSNSGSLNSGITGSSTSGATGAISAGGGTSDQVLNSEQRSSGTLTASIVGSTACAGPLN